MKHSTQISESFPLAILLTISGGFMDAYSYLCRGHVFSNAQTGNILLFGINISVGNFDTITKYLFPVLAFTFGIVIAEIIRRHFNNKKHFHWRQFVVLTETVIFITVAFLPQSANLIANSLISFACGSQVESFRKINGNGVATTMCIGNLRSATQAICDYRYNKDKCALENAMLYFSLIGLFTMGAIIGNFCVGLWRERAILICALLMLFDFLLMLINKEN